MRGNPNWLPGVVTNPHGRPKNAFAFATRVREVLAQTDAEDPERRDNLTLILLKAVDQAKQGNHDARSFLMAYGYGKPVDRVELTHEEDLGQLSPDERAAKLVELVEKAQAYLLTRRLLTTEKDDAENE